MDNLAIGAPADFSLIALFLRAGLTVKIVMVLLVLASVWSWALIIQKLMVHAAARRDASGFERRFWSGEPLDDVFDRMNGRAGGPAERIFSAGMTEWRRSQRDDGGLIAGVLQRVERAMNVAIGREGDRLTRGLPFLATVGSTAPFIGLFGTVWGIKTAFEGIALSQDTSLAVVAPGIAEALVATALGLLAAIPAVIFYNKLSSDAERISAGHEAFADEFATILSRQVEDA
ncbi:protein TolQ [Paracoccus niistensis]|uniref:Tol-Pal system protein TolQ n=1 Tax=Paracoccus niistensis TaxID=632935 RepID=A0ABV6I3U0_9RHOB